MNQDNPFCKLCGETLCLIDKNKECQEVKNYKIYKEFYESVSCLFVEGTEFHRRETIYNSIKAEWKKLTKEIYV